MNRPSAPADPFFDVPRTVAPTLEGPVELPILYWRTRYLNAFFLVDRSRVVAALAAAGAQDLEPTCTWRGRCLVGLACFEYQQTSIGPYNEIGVAVVVAPPGARPRAAHWLELLTGVDGSRQAGFYVLHLPVTTPAACAAGREIWGLPKFVTPIHFGLKAGNVAITLADPTHQGDRDSAIFELGGTLGASLPAPASSLLLYSRREGTWLRTAVNVRGAARLYRGRSLRLTVGASAHPMAATLRGLGLPGAQPSLVVTSDRFQSRLNAGCPLARR